MPGAIAEMRGEGQPQGLVDLMPKMKELLPLARELAPAFMELDKSLSPAERKAMDEREFRGLKKMTARVKP
jgi:hypothetical protein